MQTLPDTSPSAAWEAAAHNLGLNRLNKSLCIVFTHQPTPPAASCARTAVSARTAVRCAGTAGCARRERTGARSPAREERGVTGRDAAAGAVPVLQTGPGLAAARGEAAGGA